MLPGPSIHLFNALGFPISAHWSLLLAIGLMGYSYGGLAGVLLGVLVFASVLAHELGHSVVARGRQVRILGIELHLFGGVAQMVDPPRSPRDEIAIAIAGPAVSLTLGFTLSGVAWLFPSAPLWIAWIAGVNFMMGVFNLVPALPMDGGRVLRAWLASRKGLSEGTRAAVKTSRVIAVIFGVLGLLFNPWLIALAFLLWSMGNSELAQLRRHEALSAMGYEHVDPWARYDKNAGPQRSAPRVERLPPMQVDPSHPQTVLARMLGQHARPVLIRRPTQRVVRQPDGRWVVINDPHYRW